MKRYLIFGGQCFYARGGYRDLIGDAHTIAQAQAAALLIEDETSSGGRGVEWWQIVDLATGEIVAQSEAAAFGADTNGAEPHNMIFLGGHLVPEAVEVPDDQ